VARSMGRRACGAGLSPHLSLTLVAGQIGEAGDRKGEVDGGLEPGDGLTVHHAEGGAEDVVTREDGVQRLLQRRDVEVSVQALHQRHEIRRVVGVELGQEPQALLRKGERHFRLARRTQERGCLDPLPRPERGLDARAELRDGGGLEEGTEGQLDPQRCADAGDDLRREERVAAELEEARVGADLRGLEHLGEDRGEGLLDGTARGDEALLVGAAGALWRGQGLAIDLAILVDRHRQERDERRGDHVLGELLLEESAELGGGGARLLLGHQIGHEAPVRGAIFPRDDHRLAHAGVQIEGCLDFAGLDTVTSDLHLMIDAAQVLEISGGEPAREIAGAVEASARCPPRRDRRGSARRVSSGRSR
jgi:hypothetical protein